MAIAIAVLAASSCKKEPSLSITPELLEIEADGGTADLTVKANYAWSAVSGVSWISIISPSGRTDSKTLQLRISPNTHPDDRQGTVRVKCEGLEKSITVRQEQKSTVNLKDGEMLTISWNSQSFDYTTDTNVDFTASINQGSDWLSITSVKSMAEKKLTFAAEENPGTSSRQAVVSFSYKGENIQSLTVTQSGHPQRFTVWHTLTNFGAPVVFGFGMSAGTIWWGDGETSTYASNIFHSYNNTGMHEVSIVISGNDFVILFRRLRQKRMATRRRPSFFLY